MPQGTVVTICISEEAGKPLRQVVEVEAIAGQGLKGDRYCTGEGSWNKGNRGHRQVTLVNAIFFEGTPYSYADARRNIVTRGVELMLLIGKDFTVGGAKLRGVKYCDPCERPGKLCGKGGFAEMFYDRGGLVAEVLEGGLIAVDDPVIPPVRKHEAA